MEKDFRCCWCVKKMFILSVFMFHFRWKTFANTNKIGFWVSTFFVHQIIVVALKMGERRRVKNLIRMEERLSNKQCVFVKWWMQNVHSLEHQIGKRRCVRRCPHMQQLNVIIMNACYHVEKLVFIYSVCVCRRRTPISADWEIHSANKPAVNLNN